MSKEAKSQASPYRHACAIHGRCVPLCYVLGQPSRAQKPNGMCSKAPTLLQTYDHSRDVPLLAPTLTRPSSLPVAKVWCAAGEKSTPHTRRSWASYSNT